ncbi:MAG: AraC family transcriptional regulator, partial [Bacteroidota bacterium]|nr:AraC family transcriptional regulator [Bacteroidota bacterium]
CDNMITDHMLMYICSGELVLQTSTKRIVFKKGDAVFVKRNHSFRKTKQPSKNGEPFKGIFLMLKTPFLKSILSEQRFPVSVVNNAGISSKFYIILPKHPFLKGLFISLEQYFNNSAYPSEELMNAKLKEAVFALLQIDPSFASVLFDFSEPWKINLRDFMNKNYKCDLTLNEFAHYAGRSLTSFKRDFAQLFNDTPGKWLVKKRLADARSQIANLNRKPSDVYLEVGFKNLSHFSLAFKKEFGYNPTQVEKVFKSDVRTK